MTGTSAFSTCLIRCLAVKYNSEDTVWRLAVRYSNKLQTVHPVLQLSHAVWTHLCWEQICSWTPSCYRPLPSLKLLSFLQWKRSGESWPAQGAVTLSAGALPGWGFESWLPGAFGSPLPESEEPTNHMINHMFFAMGQWIVPSCQYTHKAQSSPYCPPTYPVQQGLGYSFQGSWDLSSQCLRDCWVLWRCWFFILCNFIFCL